MLKVLIWCMCSGQKGHNILSNIYPIVGRVWSKNLMKTNGAGLLCNCVLSISQKAAKSKQQSASFQTTTKTFIIICCATLKINSPPHGKYCKREFNLFDHQRKFWPLRKRFFKAMKKFELSEKWTQRCWVITYQCYMIEVQI